MDEKRLAEIERSVKECAGAVGCWEWRELVADVRRLQGMVDGLLEKHPWSYEDTGARCGYCGVEFRFPCANECAWEHAEQARDWEVASG